MRTKRFHGLKRPKIRQTWNKYNLYNLSKLQTSTRGTFYQQKWKAKSTTRSYHGEHIREQHWQQMFSPTLRSVIPMKANYLGFCDGSEQARGRGSGLAEDVRMRSYGKKHSSPDAPVPYMQMTYAPAERRLDTAVFRALFASSARQARQMVIHGGVRVNGKKMIYPGYLLNPGDMFQVDPERVMYATGAPKDREDRVATRALRKRVKAQKEAVTDSTPEDASEESLAAPVAEEKTPEEAEKAKRKEHKTELSSILQQAKDLLANQKSDLAAKRKQSIRAFASTIRKSIGNVNRTAPEDLDSELQKLMSKLSVEEAEMLNKKSEPKFVEESERAGTVSTENADKLLLRAALREIKENPVDASKPYATPWRPKPLMNAFAFIPRYLEVNHNICSAVYLRHPVARPNLAEVPSPFSYETSQLAFTWYLRRR